jgi:hypothetical protein
VISVPAPVVAVTSGAYAARSGIPDAGGVFHGCVNVRTGALRVVKSANTCHRSRTIRTGQRAVHVPGEFAVAWNQRRQKGDTGGQGTPGIAGGQGPAGPTFGVEALATSGTNPPALGSVNVIATGTITTPTAGSLYVFGHFSPNTNGTCTGCSTLIYALYIDHVPVPGSAVRRPITAFVPVALSGVVDGIAAGQHEIELGLINADGTLNTLGAGDTSTGAVLLGS